MLLLFALLGGCSPPPVAEQIVEGTVTYDRRPLWQGQIAFLGPNNRIALADIGVGGRFQVVNPPVGNVQVVVTNYPKGMAQQPPPVTGLPGQAVCDVPPPPVQKLPPRFAEPDRSGVVVEIRAGQTALHVDLPKRKDDPPYVARPDVFIGAQVGQQAPEIVGEEMQDGRPMRLSQYRGRVVALIFWAHWCSLCREQMPHYGELSRRYDGRPFDLLGVNCDPDRELVERKNDSRGVVWRSWWDGASIGGPVALAWQIDGLPGVALVDHRGVVRHRNLRGPELDRAVEALIAEAEADAERTVGGERPDADPPESDSRPQTDAESPGPEPSKPDSSKPENSDASGSAPEAPEAGRSGASQTPPTPAPDGARATVASTDRVASDARGRFPTSLRLATLVVTTSPES